MITASKYDSVKVGDFIVNYNTLAAQKAGRIVKIRKRNGQAMRVYCSNGAEFELTRWRPDHYDIYPTESEGN